MILQSSYSLCVELRLCCEKTNSENEREERDCRAGGHGARFIVGQSEAKVRAHEVGKGEIWAAIACLPETRQDGIYGQVRYDHDVSEEEEKKASVRSRLCSRLQTCMTTKMVFKAAMQGFLAADRSSD
jgi:hypothetical protein